MKKTICFIGCLVFLSACDKKPDYILNKTAMCGTISDEFVCKDTSGNDITGTVGEYWANGKKQKMFEVKNGKADGVANQYYEDGTLKIEQHYVNGKQNGVRREFYLNKKLMLEANYENGVMKGPFKTYYESGWLKLSANCKNGLNDSVDVKQYYDNQGGVFLESEAFKNGQTEGLTKKYHPNGKQKSEGVFKNGQLDGIVKEFDLDGKLVSENTYDNGALISEMISKYDDNGELLYKEIKKDGKETGILYQGETITRKQLDKKLKEKAFLDNIADCEQAVAKAAEKRKSISEEDDLLYFGTITVDKDGLLEDRSGYQVVDFASNGVFIQQSGLLSLISSKRYFVYTQDKDYATNESFRTHNKIYKRAGNYKYSTLLGGTNSIPAFKATTYKVSDIAPKTYLKNKNLSCCQFQAHEPGFKEVGFASGADYVHKEMSYGGGAAEGCKTRKHPQGYYGYQYTTYTGTDYKTEIK